MELKEGYKKTNYGVIPMEWKVVKIGNIFNFLTTTSFSRNDLHYDTTPESVYYIHYGDIHATYKKAILDFEEEVNIPTLLPKNKIIGNVSFLKDGDLIIVDASEDYDGIGACIEIRHIGNRKAISGLHTIAIRDKVNETASGYRPYIFRNGNVSLALKKIATGSKVYGISKTNLSNLEVILPPLPEQQKIAQIFSTWDKAIEKTEILIEKKQKCKKELMNKLLTGRKRFLEFFKYNKTQETKLGKIPIDWDLVSIKKFGKVITGSTPPTNNKLNYGNEFLFVSPFDINTNKIITNTEKKLSKQGFNTCRKIPVNSVLFVCIGSTIGKVAISGKELTTNQQINVIVLNKENHYNFLYYQLQLHAQRIKRIAGHQAVPIINKSTFENLKIFWTIKSEQQKIASVLSVTDKEVEVLQKQLEKLKKQKKGLMQILLTGEKRVKI